MPNGFRYRLGAVDCEVADGVGVVVGADAFGGSVTPLSEMAAYLRHQFGWPTRDVIRAASQVPARVLGLAHRKGSITPGYDAYIAVLNDDFTAWGTLVSGSWVHRAD